MPRYWRSVLIAPADVRRIRAAAELTQRELALELELTERTVERWERAGAVLERVSSLTMAFNATRYGRLEAIARRGGLVLDLVDVGLGGGKSVARVKKPKTRHFFRGGKRGARG